MILYINTSNREVVKLALQKNGKLISEVEIECVQALSEKLLPAVDKLLKDNGRQLGDIKEIRAADQGDSFTALRIGIVAANTLAFALGIEAKNLKGEASRINGLVQVRPKYNKKPNITSKKSII